MMDTNLLDLDIAKAIERYPDLKKHESEGSCFLQGNIDLKDEHGELLDKFLVKVEFPKAYPNCYPKVYDVSNRIPKEVDWHVNKDSSFCITSRPLEIRNCRYGIDLMWFIDNKLIPHLAMQLLHLEYGEKYLNGEYSHYYQGIVEGFMDITGDVTEEELSVTLISYSKSMTVGRSDNCFCGSNRKFKRCHGRKFIELDKIGRDYVLWETNNLGYI